MKEYRLAFLHCLLDAYSNVSVESYEAFIPELVIDASRELVENVDIQIIAFHQSVVVVPPKVMATARRDGKLLVADILLDDGVRLERAVSYTHLTLPTIYSV